VDDDDDVDAFIDSTPPLLDGLLKQRVIFEQQNPSKVVVKITRKLSPSRDRVTFEQQES
jgi:hypothetical protein